MGKRRIGYPCEREEVGGKVEEGVVGCALQLNSSPSDNAPSPRNGIQSSAGGPPCLAGNGLFSLLSGVLFVATRLLFG